MLTPWWRKEFLKKQICHFERICSKIGKNGNQLFSWSICQIEQFTDNTWRCSLNTQTMKNALKVASKLKSLCKVCNWLFQRNDKHNHIPIVGWGFETHIQMEIWPLFVTKNCITTFYVDSLRFCRHWLGSEAKNQISRALSLWIIREQ